MTIMLWRKDGEQFSDQNGLPLAGGQLVYKLATTETNLPIYSDPAGAVALANPVVLDASGRLNTPIYVGEAAFKERGLDAVATVVFENDGYTGSPAAITTQEYAKPEQFVAPVSASRSITSADLGRILVCDPTGGDITLTLPPASTITNGRGFKVIHVGSAGVVIVQSTSPDLVGGLPAQVMPAFGDSLEIVSDTTAWRIATASDGPPRLGRAMFLPVKNRTLSVAPVGPTQGVRYILASAGTGVWAGFAANSIAEFSGVSWINFTPSDGWYADILDENIVCRFDGASWVPWTNVLAPAPSYAAAAVFTDRQPQGTAGQVQTASSWNISRLSTVEPVPTAIVGASLAGNVMTIPTGRYRVVASRAIFGVFNAPGSRARLVSVTDANKQFLSTAQQLVGSGTVSLAFQAIIFADVEVTAASETFRLEFYANITTQVPAANVAGSDEIHAAVHWYSTAALAGPLGPQGLAGVDPGIRWAFDSSTTTAADPGTGELRLNNASLASVTEIALSYLTGEAGNPSVETFVKSWDDSTTVALRGTLIIKKVAAPQNFVVLGITSVITDGTTYGRFTVAHKSSAGAFAALDVLSVDFQRTGDTSVSVGLAAASPQGRLTLTTAVPVLVSDVTAATTIRYTPHVGELVPVYDGTDLIATVFAELTNDTTASATGKAGPAAVTTNSNYDLFVWNDAGTVRLTRGPAWTSDTARGTGAGTSELQRVKGLWTNAVAITNGPAANRGTYVGTVRSNGSSQIDVKFGASPASGGSNAIIGVWNAYNRVPVVAASYESTDSWAYATASFRSLNNNNGNRVTMIRGLNEDAVFAQCFGYATASAGNPIVALAVGLDSVTVASGSTGAVAIGNLLNRNISSYAGVPGLGLHFLQALELGGANVTFYGDNAAPTTTQAGLQVFATH
jgi:hypothetical protein